MPLLNNALHGALALAFTGMDKWITDHGGGAAIACAEESNQDHRCEIVLSLLHLFLPGRSEPREQPERLDVHRRGAADVPVTLRLAITKLG
jgi:hypothetical protein